MARKTTEEFIREAVKIHGDKYDYSQVEYRTCKDKVKIICPKHGVFEQEASSHINPLLKAGCPYCGHKKVFAGETDLESQYPKIAELFDEEANGCKASDVFAKTNKKYFWKCDNGKPHTYLMSPNSKCMHGYKCPVCSGQQLLEGVNDLETKYPEIAKEWDYEKNEKTPSDYSYGSGHKAWWICKDCGESYQSYINVHIRGHKCPYCAGLKIKRGMNDLQTLFPDIAAEYSEDNEIPVNQISASTHKKVKWVCPRCEREYIADVHHRTSKDRTNCPYCKMSKGEMEIAKILDENNINYKTQTTFPDLRGEKGHFLRYDFTVYDKDGKWVGALEYNGKQHYEPVNFFGGKEGLEERKLHDMKKAAYALNHGALPVSIPYASCGGYTTELLTIIFLDNLGLLEGR